MEKRSNNYSTISTDTKLLEILKKISTKGYNAEVKQNRDGTWTVYDVKKEKTMII